MVKVNGLQGPYDPLQITGWSFIFFFLITFFSVIGPVVPHPGNIICLVIGGIGAVTVIGTMITGSYVNPADPRVDCKRAPDESPSTTNGKTPFDNSTYCYLCQVYVSKTAKHCRVCDKCVIQFDHHCKWLNNCVGVYNYKIFASVVISALCTAFFILCVVVYLFVNVVRDDPTVMKSIHDMYPNFTKGGYIALLVIEVILLCLTVVLLSQLLGLHIYLAIHRMSTYDYIIKKRKAKKEAELQGKGKGKAGKKGKVYVKPGAAQRGRGTFATGETPPLPKQPWWKCGRGDSSSKYKTKSGTGGHDSDAAPLTPSSRDAKVGHTRSTPPATQGRPPLPPKSRPRPPPVSTATNDTAHEAKVITAGLPETPTWRAPKPKPTHVSFDTSGPSSSDGVGLAYPVKRIDFAGHLGSKDGRTTPSNPDTPSSDITGGLPSAVLRTAHSASSVRLSQRSSTGSVRSTTSSRILTGRDWAEAGVIDPHLSHAPARVHASTARHRAPSPMHGVGGTRGDASTRSLTRSTGSSRGELPELRSTPPPSPSLHFATPEFAKHSRDIGVPAEDAAPF